MAVCNLFVEQTVDVPNLYTLPLLSPSILFTPQLLYMQVKKNVLVRNEKSCRICGVKPSKGAAAGNINIHR